MGQMTPSHLPGQTERVQTLPEFMWSSAAIQSLLSGSQREQGAPLIIVTRIKLQGQKTVTGICVPKTKTASACTGAG